MPIHLQKRLACAVTTHGQPLRWDICIGHPGDGQLLQLVQFECAPRGAPPQQPGDRGIRGGAEKGAHELPTALCGGSAQREVWSADLHAAGLQVAAFIGAASDREVVFTRNATEAINLVAQTWGLENIKEGDEVQLAQYAKGCSSLCVLGNTVWLMIDMRFEFDLLMHDVCLLQIVLSVAEHHGNLVPWQMLAQRTGAVLRHAELTSTQEVDVEVRSTDSFGEAVCGVANPTQF